MTDGQKLVDEYRGVKLIGDTAQALAMRIDRLIDIATAKERHECSELAKEAWGAMVKRAA